MADQKEKDMSLIYAIDMDQVEEVKDLLKNYDLEDNSSKICTRSMTAKRARMQRMSEKLKLTVLEAAIVGESLDILNLLLANGFRLNYSFFEAAEILQLPLSSRFDASECKIHSDPLLHLAISTRNREIVELLLKNGVDLKAWGGSVALHWAAQHGNFEIVKMILDLGANINDKDKFGRIPLVFAARGGDWEIIQLLVNLGSLKNLQKRDLLNLIRLVDGYEHQKAYRLLLDAIIEQRYPDCLPEALHEAVRKGCNELVVKLLDKGADVDMICSGRTALQVAVSSNNLNLVELLLARGANIQELDNMRRNVLHLAVANRNVDIICVLLKNGAKDLINRRDANQRNVIHMCVEKQDPYLMDFLMGNGGSMNVENVFGQTPLEIAVQKGYTDVSKMIIKRLVRRRNSDLSSPSNQARRVAIINSVPLLSNYFDDCNQEFVRIKETAISNSTVLYADILKMYGNINDLNKLAGYAANENILSEMQTVETKFPIFGAVILSKFKYGKARKVLLDQGKSNIRLLLSRLSCNYQMLPDTCVYEILGYLSNEDLRNASKVCETLNN